jgi:alpha-1,6-mannosyltransferase
MGLVAIPRVNLTRVPALAGAAALAGLVACGALICLHAAAGGSTGLIPAAWHGEPGWLSGPLPGLGGGLTSHTYVPLFLAMCGCYAVVLCAARHLDARMAIGAIVVLHALFLLAPPLLSADVFGYIDYARIGALHGLDPYAHGPASAPHDVVFAFMRWRGDMPSPYGPLFTLGSYALAPLSVGASLWALKGLVAAASLAIVWLVWDCARRLRIEPLPAAVLVGLNPLVLVWAVGGAHNDLIVVAAATAGVWLAVRGRERIASAGLVIAAGLKLSAGVGLPFLVAGARRRGALAGAAMAGAAVIALTFAAFGTGVAGMLRAQADQQNIVASESLPEQAGRVLGLGGATPGLRTVALVLFAAAFVALLVRTWRGATDWVTATGWATLAMLVTSAWLMPWYVTWLLPLAALGRDRRLVAATLALCAYLVVMRTPL